MKLHHFLLRTTSRRRFATKYTARVIDTSTDGRSVAVEIDSLVFQTDVRGYALPRRDLICKVTQILLKKFPSSSSPPDDDPFLHLSDYLQTLTLTITPSEASEIIKSLNHPKKALQFFRFCSSSIPNFRHDCFTYNRLLLILSKSLPNPLDLIRRIVDEMDRSSVRGNISTINLLIGIFGGDVTSGEGLEKCIGLVKKWDLSMNCYTYKCLLQAYLRSKNSTKAFDVYREMRRRGYNLDIFGYNMLIDSLARDEKHFDRLRRHPRFLQT